MASNRARNAAREAVRAQALAEHPRCTICSETITWKPGRNLKSRTCGRRACAVALHNWTRDYRKPRRERCARPDCRRRIPEERNANSLYCSIRCNRTMSMRRRRAREKAA